MNQNRISYSVIYAGLVVLLLITITVAIRIGAVDLTYSKIVQYLLNSIGYNTESITDPIEEGLFLHIRLPRVLLCIVVGAALSVSGTLMQALFRNPIVEPGLIGTSSGAALGAASIFVLGKHFSSLSNTYVASVILPGAAFAGGLMATLAVYYIASSKNRINVSTMILAGIAINAIAASGTGYLSYIARDPQARSITFWNLGTLSGSNWNSFFLVCIITLLAVLIALRFSKSLNAIMLGESEALYLGVNPERLKMGVILLNTLMVAVATSMVGVIGFIGLVVPHLLRMLKTADNRYLIIGSSLLGASLLTIADMMARIIIAPAELPIGIITALIGAPVFIWMLTRQNKSGSQGGFYA
jgi:iron complex transport system permease protein